MDVCLSCFAAAPDLNWLEAHDRGCVWARLVRQRIWARLLVHEGSWNPCRPRSDLAVNVSWTAIEPGWYR